MIKHKTLLVLVLLVITLMLVCIYFGSKGSGPKEKIIEKIDINVKKPIQYIDFETEKNHYEIEKIIDEDDYNVLASKVEARFENIRKKAEQYAKFISQFKIVKNTKKNS